MPFYLALYIQNITYHVINTKIINMVFCIFKYGLQNLVCLILTAHLIQPITL